MARVAAAAVAAGLVALVTAGAPGGCGLEQSPSCVFVDQGAGPAGAVPIRAERVVSGLEIPWGIAFLSSSSILVTERPGRLRLVHDGVLEPTPVATIPVHVEGEGGLLGIALSPSFASTRAFYLYLSSDEGGRTRNRIERWTLAPDARSAAFDRVILDDIPWSDGHDGGRIRFGPDGMLYAGTGDAHDRSLPQDLGSYGGKILRMTEDGAAPPDNPWTGNVVYIEGVRNVEAFDWIDVTNAQPAQPGSPNARIVIAEHGPSGELGRTGHDRVTVAHAAANLGWWIIYGCYEEDDYLSAALSWDMAIPPGGASFYTGSAIPEWRGSLIIGVLGARQLHRVVFDARDPTRVASHEVYLKGDPPAGLGRVRDVVMGPDGQMYVTTSNCDGRGTCPPFEDAIYRITR